jgi:hypothetical protein
MSGTGLHRIFSGIASVDAHATGLHVDANYIFLLTGLMNGRALRRLDPV